MQQLPERAPIAYSKNPRVESFNAYITIDALIPISYINAMVFVNKFPVPGSIYRSIDLNQVLELV